MAITYLKDWRFNQDNSIKNDFVLNNPTYSGSILVGETILDQVHQGSMQHGQYMITDLGVFVSSFFADIFKNNCLNIGYSCRSITIISESYFEAIATTPKQIKN